MNYHSAFRNTWETPGEMNGRLFLLEHTIGEVSKKTAFGWAVKIRMSEATRMRTGWTELRL